MYADSAEELILSWKSRKVSLSGKELFLQVNSLRPN